jgi:hypothetical protein
LLVASVALSSCAAVGLIEEPPQTLRGDVATRVSFVTDVEGLCALFGVEASAPGTSVVACTSAGGEIVVSNPCSWASWDAYARLLCHELGHANGWSHSSPEIQDRYVAGPPSAGGPGQARRAPEREQADAAETGKAAGQAAEVARSQVGRPAPAVETASR